MSGSQPPTFPGLDYDFLRYMGVLPENQRRIQSHYLPYFENCKKVVDLGCGDADFVALLLEKGIDVIGVDADDKACEVATEKGLPVVQADVFDWLHEQPDESVDGVFSAHFIEHVPFPKVIELTEQAFRVLQPGGVVLLVTPNARSLFSHLEMFYTHFGHVTFYHPRLVSFFLDRVGFGDVQFGENPETASPLLFELRQVLNSSLPVSAVEQDEPPSLDLPSIEIADELMELPAATPFEFADVNKPARFTYQREIPLQGRTPFHYLSFWVKRILGRWIVQPLTDSLAQSLRDRIELEERQNEELLDQLRERDQALLQAQTALAGLIVEQVESSRIIHRSLHTAIDHVHTAIQQEREVRSSQVAALEVMDQEIYERVRTFATEVQTLNRPFETFVWAYKPVREIEAVEENELDHELADS